MSLAGLLNQEVQIQGADRHHLHRRSGVCGCRYLSGPDLLQAAPGPDRDRVERSSYARVTVAVEAGDEDLVVLPDGVERVPLQISRVYDGSGQFHHSSIDV